MSQQAGAAVAALHAARASLMSSRPSQPRGDIAEISLAAEHNAGVGTLRSQERWGISYRSFSRLPCSFPNRSGAVGLRSARMGTPALKLPRYTLHTCVQACKSSQPSVLVTTAQLCPSSRQAEAQEEPSRVGRPCSMAQNRLLPSRAMSQT